jgi:ATP/maltotriose-dependent transcriptional regulator MalT
LRAPYFYPTPPSLLDIALDHLTLARCALYAALLRGEPSRPALEDAEEAVAGLRAAGNQHHIPRGLLPRASLRHALGDLEGARADLEEAQRIAARGGMCLHLADRHLSRARLFRDHAELARARTLIEECGYGRRRPELEDAEGAK